jgi:SAM-dependent methyltransferase
VDVHLGDTLLVRSVRVASAAYCGTEITTPHDDGILRGQLSWYKLRHVQRSAYMRPYTEEYFARLRGGAESSARVIVPLVMKLAHPRSVIDVGCGPGSWLSVFNGHGVEDFLGIDGEWINKQNLRIPKERFVPFDLERPFRSNRRYDLVISLEVAEHLPNKCAETFINTLTGLGSVVLFSAAIPYQGGDQHVNEQWPEYWMELFRNKDFVAIDCLRKKVWCNKEVEPWYAQNIILYVARGHLQNQPTLKKAYELHGTSQLAVVHPRMYLHTIENTIERVEYENSLYGRFVRVAKRILPNTVQNGMHVVRGRVRSRMS